VSHTPGPWHTVSSQAGAFEVYDDNGEFVAFARDLLKPDLECQANAHLIAASPELLALVRKHLEDHLEACHITRMGKTCSLVAETRAVLAKAEGREVAS
jgi:hypothetical protein